jgi:D-tyrosyl-tRNA(Tyr) deacylase
VDEFSGSHPARNTLSGFWVIRKFNEQDSKLPVRVCQEKPCAATIALEWQFDSVDLSRFRLESRGRRAIVRAVIQRVSRASVTVEGRVAGEVGAGLLVLLGVSKTDNPESAAYLAEKIANLRIFSDEAGKLNLSVLETGGSALVVSQFTLYGDTRGGRRPSYIQAAPPEEANRLYQEFIRSMRALGVRVETGVFQAHMQVELVNDGPVTILIDSEKTI